MVKSAFVQECRKKGGSLVPFLALCETDVENMEKGTAETTLHALEGALLDAPVRHASALHTPPDGPKLVMGREELFCRIYLAMLRNDLRKRCGIL